MSTHANHATHANSHAPSSQGAHAHHGHFIVPLATLRLVLLALLFFTLLTVGLSKGEAILADTFNFEIPQWINVVVAMSIACVKTAIVVLFFMQLKYDSPLNSMIFIFTLLTVCFFLGFTMIDLGNRQTLDRFKGVYISPGGTGIKTAGKPITLQAKEDYLINKQDKDSYAPHHDDHAADAKPPKGSFTDSGYRDPVPALGSTPERSNPVKGLTLPGFAPDPHKDNAPNDNAHTDPKPASGH